MYLQCQECIVCLQPKGQESGPEVSHPEAARLLDKPLTPGMGCADTVGLKHHCNHTDGCSHSHEPRCLIHCPFLLSLETRSFSKGSGPLRSILAELPSQTSTGLSAEQFKHGLKNAHLGSFTCSLETVTLAENDCLKPMF